MGLEYYLAGLAAFLLALNQGLKDAPQIRSKIPALNFPGWFNYLPLPIILVAFGVHYFSKSTETIVSTSATKVEGLPIEAIAEAMTGTTNAQKERRLEPFGTLTAGVEGVVSDVCANDGEFTLVWLDSKFSGRRVTLIFNKGLENPEAINIGSKLKAKCHFSSIDRDSLTLNRCSIASVEISNP